MTETIPHSEPSRKTIAVFGAGPGLGRAVAKRYADEGYTVCLVARRQEQLVRMADELSDKGAKVHVVAGDLLQADSVAGVARQVRDRVGHLDALYYAPTPDAGFVPAVNLTAQQAQASMPLSYYTLVSLVQAFLPDMLERGDGAILTAQGASSVQGLPYMSGPGPAQAAQRNYLQSLHAEVAGRGVYVGMLYIGVAIRQSAFHQEMERAKAAGEPVWEMASVDPDHLADLLWSMHRVRAKAEVRYPEDFDKR